MEYKKQKIIKFSDDIIGTTTEQSEGVPISDEIDKELKGLFDYFLCTADLGDEMDQMLKLIGNAVSIYRSRISKYFQPIHMEKMIFLLRKRVFFGTVFLIIHDFIIAVPVALDILIKLDFFGILKNYIYDIGAKAVINFVIDIFSICNENMWICIRNEVYSKLFPNFIDDIAEEMETYNVEYSNLCFKMCHYGNYPNEFGDTLSSIFYSFLQNSNVCIVINGIKGMEQLLMNRFDISSFVFLESYSETCIIEELTSFLIHQNRDVQVTSLCFLSNLFIYKDAAMKAMDYFGTLSEVRKLVKSGIQELVGPALDFFYNWCLNTREYYSKLLDEISEINFVEICRNHSYTIKRQMTRMLLAITVNAIPYHVEKILSFELIITLFEQISNFDEQYSEYLIKIIINSINKCQDSPTFIDMIKKALEDEYIFSNYQEYINRIRAYLP